MRRHVIDRRGVEGLPLKLLITAVVMAITVPMMFGALKTYDRARVRQEVEAEIQDTVESIQMLYVSGPGNSMVLDIDIPSGSLSHVDYVRLGAGLNDTLASTVRYRMSGQPESVVVVKDPNAPMSSTGNKTLELPPGHYSVRAECVLARFDINGDGLWPDAYVSLAVLD